MLLAIDPLIAAGVVLATAATDAVYVMFTSAVVARRRVPAASWSSVWYLLSSFAVIHYTENWVCHTAPRWHGNEFHLSTAACDSNAHSPVPAPRFPAIFAPLVFRFIRSVAKCAVAP